MKLTKVNAERITNTLPIGFYTGRNIPVTIEEKGEMSWYNPKEDTIGISLDQLSKGTEGIDDLMEFERMVRSNFYHEVSHAILTPQDMQPLPHRNIFEDERIERLLKDYYFGVDFKKSLYTINGYPPPKPETLEQWFFLLCRYGIGKPELLEKVAEIIERHKGQHRNSNPCEYQWDIDELYEELKADMKADPEYYENIADKLGEGEMPTEGDLKGGSGDDDGEGKGSGSGSDGEGTGDGERTGEPAKGEGLSRGQILEQMKRMTEPRNPLDENLYNAMATLFENYKRKNKGGSALQAHSGVLNARLADRADYRMFERPSPCRGSNQFGSFHLNLFIDVSGSFHGNDNTVNNFLQVLDRIEQTNSMFTYDVITVGAPYREEILPRHKREISSGGGNHLSKRIFEIFRKQQLPQTYNYNIVMFDGDAYSNDCEIPSDIRLPDGKGFLAFAANNCTIITDYDNKEYIDKWCPTTRTIYTRKFCTEFFKNIQQIMALALS